MLMLQIVLVGPSLGQNAIQPSSRRHMPLLLRRTAGTPGRGDKGIAGVVATFGASASPGAAGSGTLRIDFGQIA